MYRTSVYYIFRSSSQKANKHLVSTKYSLLSFIAFEELEHIQILFLSVCSQGNFEILSCEDCRLATPPGFFRGFGPHVHLVFLFVYPAERTSLIFDYC